MRLNGKAAIMAYLGKRHTNVRSWYAIREMYGRVIYCRARNGKVNRGYWALAEDLDALDKARCATVADLDKRKLEQEAITWTERTTLATAMHKRRQVEARERELVPA